MASHPSFDSSISHSATPHRAGQLNSFATTFNQDDYDQPPPGVDSRDWARLAQQQRGAREDRTEDSLLDEGPTPGGGLSGGESYDEEQHQQQHQLQHPRTRTISARSSSSRPTSSSSSRTQPPSNSYSSSAPSPSPYDTTLRSDAPDEQSVSTDVDQTQTTELLSQRLAGPNGAGDDTTVDESTTSSIYGGRPPKKRSSGGVGQNMTLREQEKVRFPVLHKD
jgi:hypothetical protein